METSAVASSSWFLGLLILLVSSLGLVRCELVLNAKSDELSGLKPAEVNAYCMGFIYNTGTDNLQKWRVPPECEQVVKRYMTKGGYRRDLGATCSAALQYFSSIKPGPLDTVVFDVDETLLSNIPYYRIHHWGVEAFDSVQWDAWTDKAAAPALGPVLELYNNLKDLGWVLVLLTGRHEEDRRQTTTNLKRIGYGEWFELMLRAEAEHGIPATIFKSGRRVEFEKRGYKVRGCIGDQWSDLRGNATGDRVFKLPNPMYYIG